MQPSRPTIRNNESGGTSGTTAATVCYEGYGVFRGGAAGVEDMGSSNTRCSVSLRTGGGAGGVGGAVGGTGGAGGGAGGTGGGAGVGRGVGGGGAAGLKPAGFPATSGSEEFSNTTFGHAASGTTNGVPDPNTLGSDTTSTVSGLYERLPTVKSATSSGPLQCSNSQICAGSNVPRRIVGQTSAYETGRLLGNGSFGVVCEAQHWETKERVAIKKVLQDPRYKNRELDVMKELCHPNVVALKDYFFTETPALTTAPNNGNTGGVPAGTHSQDTQRFLNVVMEHVPDTVYRVMKSYLRNGEQMPLLLVRLYTYQMCRSLGYIHSLGICHRDIKPQNLLVDPRFHVLKLCDFGSAKRLSTGEHSVAYICSRFYRAPELMLGATEYTTAIDIWSIGCVLGELLIGKPLFPGDSSVDQLVKIIQVLGTPTRQQMHAMNPNYTEFRFPDVRPKDWKSVISNASTMDRGSVCPAALDLLSAFLKYEPHQRLLPYEALAHPFFDPLRDPNCRLPDGSPLPPLFNFGDVELQAMSPETQARLLTPWTSPKVPRAVCSNEVVYNNSPSWYHHPAAKLIGNGMELGLVPPEDTDTPAELLCNYGERSACVGMYTNDLTSQMIPEASDALHPLLAPTSLPSKPTGIFAPNHQIAPSTGQRLATCKGVYVEDDVPNPMATTGHVPHRATVCQAVKGQPPTSHPAQHAFWS